MDAKILQQVLDDLSRLYNVPSVEVDRDCYDHEAGAARLITDRQISIWLSRIGQPYYIPFKTRDTNNFWTSDDPADPKHLLTVGLWKLHRHEFIAPIVALDQISPINPHDTRSASGSTADYCLRGKFRAFYRPLEGLEDHIRSHRYSREMDKRKWYRGRWAVLDWEVTAFIRERDA